MKTGCWSPLRNIHYTSPRGYCECCLRSCSLCCRNVSVASEASSSSDSRMKAFKRSTPSPVAAEMGTTCLNAKWLFGLLSLGNVWQNSAPHRQFLNVCSTKAPVYSRLTRLPSGLRSCSFSCSSLWSASGRSILLTTSRAGLLTSSSL